MVARDEFGRIGVLMGGPSSERQISLKSGKAVYEALKAAGVDALSIDITTDNIEENIRLIESRQINCAFIALHGRFGEDGQAQNILEALKMPYTGSGVLASRLAMDKVSSRQIFASHDLAVPRYQVMYKNCYLSKKTAKVEIGFPMVVKPATHGSSIGLSIIHEPAGLTKALESAFEFDEKIVIEEYIKGRELTVGILEEEALPVIEIIPSKSFFDYEAKYQAGLTEYVVPAVLDEALAKKIQFSALSAHRLLGCFGCSRVDLILSGKTPFILEVNTIPGLTSTSLLPKAAKIVGIDFTQLCLKLIRLAYANAKSRSNSEGRSSRPKVIPFKLIGGLFIILLVISLGLGYIWRILTTSEYFRIEEVINQESKKADLSYLKGKNIFSVDLKSEALLILGSFPDYSQVKLIRLLPNKIFVYFLRRKPVALVRLYKYFALDKDGVFFYPPADPKEFDLPLITGLETKIFGVKPGTRYNNREVLLALTIIRESKRNRALKGYRIKKIDLANTENVSLLIPVERNIALDPRGTKMPAVDNLEVKLGPENVKAKFNILGNLLMNSKNELSNTRYIDLRFKEPVIKLKDVK